MRRNTNLDLLKGVLIILVVAGHVLEGQLSESLPRYLIYAFHMPLFLGIAGFLFDYEKCGQRRLLDVLSKLLGRVALPYLTAVLVYCSLLNVPHLGEPRVFLTRLAESFERPYLHLWFIPAYVVFSLSTWLLRRLGLSGGSALLVALALSLAGLLVPAPPAELRGDFLYVPLDGALHILRPYFFVFFVLGSVLRRGNPRRGRTANLVFSLALAVGTVLLYFFPHYDLQALNFFLLNFALIRLLLGFAATESLPGCRWLEWMGRNSLPLYLWHVVPILCARHLVRQIDVLPYPLVVLALLAIGLMVIYRLTGSELLNRFLFGAVKDRPKARVRRGAVPEESPGSGPVGAPRKAPRTSRSARWPASAGRGSGSPRSPQSVRCGSPRRTRS
jgi:fucose 4-O-acetylase-like acetyltransferase